MLRLRHPPLEKSVNSRGRSQNEGSKRPCLLPGPKDLEGRNNSCSASIYTHIKKHTYSNTYKHAHICTHTCAHMCTCTHTHSISLQGHIDHQCHGVGKGLMTHHTCPPKQLPPRTPDTQQQLDPFSSYNDISLEDTPSLASVSIAPPSCSSRHNSREMTLVVDKKVFGPPVPQSLTLLGINE